MSWYGRGSKRRQDVASYFRERNRSSHEESGWCPGAIFKACTSGDLKHVKEVLAKGSDVNERSTPDRATPLMVAAKFGHTAVVDFLLKKQANVNCVDEFGRTALMVACRLGNVESAKALVYSYQSDLDKVDEQGNSALILTASNLKGTPFLEIMKLLVKEDADVNIRNGVGMTAVMYCTKNSSVGLEAMKMLIAAGANPKAINDFQENLLMQAASQGDNEILEWIMEMEMEVNDITETSESGDNALILALKSGNLKCVDMLLKAGSCPNSFSGQGCHSLNIAVAVSFEITLLLLSCGAVPQRSNIYVQEEISQDATNLEKNAFTNSLDVFQPTDVAVLHKNFSVAMLLLTKLSCYPSYHVYSDSQLELLSESTRVVLDCVCSSARLCPQWIKILQENPRGPNTLLFLSQQVVSNLAGSSVKRRENLLKCELPSVLVRDILFEGLEETMFHLPIESDKDNGNFEES